ncbi:MAG: methyl-accepting chemotaxis protein [Spirochaetales bacterium]|nr:methyl-accepting chemotaxis protein [Spirochaetales bacterium]
MKLKMRFILPLSALTAFGLIIVSSILYISAKQEIQSLSLGQMVQVAESLVRSVDDYHKKLESDIKDFSLDDVYGKYLISPTKKNLSAANSVLKTLQSHNPGYQNIALVNFSGNVVACSDESLIDNLNVSNRDYFISALNGRVAIGDAVLSSITNTPTNTVSMPVKNGKAIMGVLIAVADLSSFNETFMNSVKIGENGYAFMYDNNGTMVAHRDKSLLFNNYAKNSDYGRYILSEGNGVYKYEYNGSVKIMAFRQTAIKDWYVVVTAKVSDLYSGVYKVFQLTIIIVMIVLVMIIFIIWMLVASVVRPIKVVVADAKLIADGDLRTKGKRNNLVERKDEIGELAHAFEDMVVKLKDVVVDVRASSETVYQNSEQLTATAEELSQGATEQAANSEEVSSAMEEMGATIEQNADNSVQTEKIARQASLDAERGGAAVLETVQAMRLISEKVKIIDDIARNTNILSLNASIEAARAGSQGKGVAVVAVEVGKLAANSQKAAKEIFELANSSVGKAEQAGALITKIVGDIKNTAELVEEISASSSEQNTGVVQINNALVQLDQAIQSNVASSEETSSMAEKLSIQAENLAGAIDFFKIDNENRVATSKEEDPFIQALFSDDPYDNNSAETQQISLPEHGDDYMELLLENDFEAF